MKITISKIEFWAATLLLIVGVYGYLDNADYFLGPDNFRARDFKEHGFRYNYFVNYLFPEISRLILLYLGFIFLNYVVVNRFEKRKYDSCISYTLLTCLCIAISFTIADMLQRPYNNNFYNRFIENTALLLLFLGIFFLYTVIKKGLESYLLNSGKQNNLATRIMREILIAATIWGGILILLIQDRSTRDFAHFWVSIVPFAFVFFQLNIYWLLPKVEKSGTIRFVLVALALSIPLYMPFGLLFMSISYSRALAPYFLIWGCCLLIILPLSYYVYQRNKDYFQELGNLKKKLKATASGLQFLRSQINPHFLFNALNTLYGTALQEKSERTAQGIQKLGDMMRFMLHENNQEKILLVREIAYIRNYIDLQLLRTRSSPDIVVETDITDTLNDQHIAPMLLIPFIENAFKHGISLSHRSWIKITLHADTDKLYFDVSNSIHNRSGTDTEKDQSGIGLNNVQQRLQLIYPDDHELVIRETRTEFFVHLTLNL